jgi:hypothetical protein
MSCEQTFHNKLFSGTAPAGPSTAHAQLEQTPKTLTPGHDTTSFTLTAMIFFVATHPEVEAAVIGEVDRWGRDKPISVGDLAEFPYINVRAWAGGGVQGEGLDVRQHP